MKAAFRGKESTAMTGIETRSTALADTLRSTESHRGIRLVAGTLIALGAFGLTGCAASHVDAAPTPTPTRLNNLTEAELSAWKGYCILNVGQQAIDLTWTPDAVGKLPQATVDYYRAAFKQDEQLYGSLNAGTWEPLKIDCTGIDTSIVKAQ